MSSERHIVVGRSGSGKTYTAKRIAAALLRNNPGARLVVFDPTDSPYSWRPAGACYVTERIDLLRALRNTSGPVVCRGVFEDWSPCDQLAGLVFVVDEAHRWMSPHSIHPSASRIALHGRHYGIHLVAITQRPRDVHGDVLANATRVWVHELIHRRDREAIERGLDVDLRGRTWERPAGAPAGVSVPLVWPESFQAPAHAPASDTSDSMLRNNLEDDDGELERDGA